MQDNINTKKYWNQRFLSGDWEQKKGREQTTAFAYEQMKRIKLSQEFKGLILDFGCGLGDALPIYKEHIPFAKIIGLDHSAEAIKKCQEKYADVAEFIVGDENNVPEVDVIITSNVFEHLSNYILIARNLIKKCKKMYVIVPYDEDLTQGFDSEHINSFNTESFSDFNVIKKITYKTKGFAQKGFFWIFWNIHIKNVGRYMLYGRTTKYNSPKQIIFEIRGSKI